MRAKRYPFRGLDLRSNILNRIPGSARLAENCRLDANKNLIKREELASLSVPRETTATPANFSTALPPLDLGFNTKIIDFFEYDEDHFFLIIKVEDPGSPGDFYNKFYRYTPSSNTVSEVLPNSGGVTFGSMGHVPNSTFGLISDICSSQKLNNSLYFVSREGATPTTAPFPQNPPYIAGTLLDQGSSTGFVYKYNGYTVHRSGVAGIDGNYVEDSGTLGGTNYYIRNVNFYMDPQGYFHQIWHSTEKDDSATFPKQRTVSGGSSISGYSEYQASACSFVCDTNFSGDFTSGSITLSAQDIDVVEGQYVLFFVTVSFTFYLHKFKVKSVAAGSVELSERQIFISGEWKDLEDTQTIDVFAGDIFCNVFSANYISQTYNTGFDFNSYTSLPTQITTYNNYNINPGSPQSVPAYMPLAKNFEDGINEGLIRVRPPLAKSMAVYDNALLLIDDFNLYFSDISLGGSVESFAAFDNFTAGEDKFGPLKGVFANEEYIVLMREFQSYYIIGNIFTGNFRVQNYNQTKIGCSSPTSIEQIDGQCIFASFRGIYLAAQGAQMQEISDRIEPAFISDVLSYNFDVSKTTAALDPWREYILFYIPSKTSGDAGTVILYSYYHDEWFTYRSVDASGGILMASDQKLYTSDGDELYGETATYSNGVLAKYYSNYDDLGEPTLLKRFVKINLIQPFLGVATLAFKAFKNWKASNQVTNTTMTNPNSSPINSKRVDPTLAYSMSLGIESSGTNKMNISGYEYEIQPEQDGVTDASID